MASVPEPDPNAAERLGFRTPGDQAVFLCEKLGFGDEEIGRMLAAAASHGPDTPWARAYRMCCGLVGERMEAASSYISRGMRKHDQAAMSGEQWDLAATILERELGSAASAVTRSINSVYIKQEVAMLKIMKGED